MINAVDGFRDVCQPLEHFGDIWQEILLKLYWLGGVEPIELKQDFLLKLYWLGGVEHLAKATEIAPFPVVAKCVED